MRRSISSSRPMSGRRNNRRPIEPTCSWAAVLRLSRTDIDWNTCSSWNVRARPALARRCGRQRLTSRPCSSTLPGIGTVLPEDAVEERRLAAPVGPDDAEDLALLEVERDIVDRPDPAEGLA